MSYHCFIHNFPSLRGSGLLVYVCVSVCVSSNLQSTPTLLILAFVTTCYESKLICSLNTEMVNRTHVENKSLIFLTPSLRQHLLNDVLNNRVFKDMIFCSLTQLSIGSRCLEGHSRSLTYFVQNIEP